MRRICAALALTAVSLALGACSLVKLTPDGENVALLTADQVGNCRRMADTQVSVLDRVGVNRNRDRVARELAILARNAAAERGGDTVVATSPPQDGEQNFDIYRCRN